MKTKHGEFRVEIRADTKQLLFYYAFSVHSTNIFMQYLGNGEPGLKSPESRGHVRDQCSCAFREQGVLVQIRYSIFSNNNRVTSRTVKPDETGIEDLYVK